MNFLAVDDEAFALEDLKRALAEAAPDSRITGFSNPGQALEYIQYNRIDTAFLDTELGSMNGLILAKKLKDIQPDIRIVFVTSHEQYALGAFRIHASGYLLKPITAGAILEELTFLYGEHVTRKKVRIQTFGGFEVYVEGKPLYFGRSKAKELLAYLVDKRGGSVTNGDASAALWEEKENSKAQKSYYRIVVSQLRGTLREAGIENILVKGHNSLAIIPELLDCDSYRFLDGEPQAINSYRHNYLPGYHWAEFSIGILERCL